MIMEENREIEQGYLIGVDEQSTSFFVFFFFGVCVESI